MGVATNLTASSVLAARCTLCDNDDFIDDDVNGLSGITTLIGCNCGTTSNITHCSYSNMTTTLQAVQSG